jgi:hypothetical protein
VWSMIVLPPLPLLMSERYRTYHFRVLRRPHAARLLPSRIKSTAPQHRMYLAERRIMSRKDDLLHSHTHTAGLSLYLG